MAISVSELLNGVASRLVYEGSVCGSYPCWNDGKCVLNGSSTDFFCECSAFFVGPRCEFKTADICRSPRCRGVQLCNVADFHVNCSVVNQTGENLDDFKSFNRKKQTKW
ncbi:unnamed protein product [Caenorhabditis bovis]|uniref:EGF-like domain-containing protein n=1 Tax=Caenorhabditis bovis TaxID=2654633 RepID=A0A8S1EFN4_9PELO|nr:unnamed protein product [Caenorhabditis bovis]